MSHETRTSSRILVVDDEPFNRDLLVQQLDAYETRVASSGEEALAMVASSPPDLILLDVMMPGIDGFEVCNVLKSRDDTRFIPIVIMTALDAAEDRIRGIEAGADDFLTKPVDERQLLARIRTALRAKHSLDRKLDIAASMDRIPKASTPAGGVRACAKCGAVYSVALPNCALDGEPIQFLDADPMLGRRLDRYMILGRVGSGGMGCVYLASHATLKKQRYAVKIPYGELALQKEHAERFFREADACAALDHPNVVSVLDFGATPEGLPYMVMEYVTGRTLKDILQEGPLKFERTAAIARQIASGLAHAHDRGIVHRDVKPSNVMVSEHDGMELAKLLDFGVVAQLAVESTERLTATNNRIGTPLYMSPEQIEHGTIGPAADLYALGVTLYQMIAGRPPFESSGIKLAAEKLMLNPAALTTKTGLEPLACRLLAPEPSDRPASGREVIAAIDEVVAAKRSSRRGMRAAATADEDDQGIISGIRVGSSNPPAGVDDHPTRAERAVTPASIVHGPTLRSMAPPAKRGPLDRRLLVGLMFAMLLLIVALAMRRR
ncbi:MAG TPA: protein kinase [Polyangiaceae bacterium]